MPKNPPASQDPQKLAESWIQEMTEYGFTQKDMCLCFQELRNKLASFKARMETIKANKK